MKENVRVTVRNILTSYLEQNNLRKTPERFAILDAVYSINGHFTLDELGDKLNTEDRFPVSRATLYNTLRLFMALRLVIRHRFQVPQSMRPATTTTATAIRFARSAARFRSLSHRK